jgi:hypothetical protein
MGGRHALFHGSLGVSFEQHAGFAKVNLEHKRVIVLGLCGRMPIRRRREHADLHAAEIESISIYMSHDPTSQAFA